MAFRRDAFNPAWWRDPPRKTVIPSPAAVGDGRRERRAGIVHVSELAASPRLPMTASFASSTWGTAFWLVRASGSGEGTLYISSGARVLWDCGNEVLGSGGGTSARDAVWSEGLLQRLRATAQAQGALVPSSIPSTGTLPANWLRVALWYTYHRDTHPGAVEVVRLPTASTLPELGAYLGLGEQPTQALSHYDPALFATNPWGPAQVDVPPVDTTRPPAPSSDSSGGGMLLALLAAAALALAGGTK